MWLTMTIEKKLHVIKDLIRHLNVSQEDITDTLRQTCEIPISDGNTEKHLEALSIKVRDIENKIEDQSSAINEASKFARKLLENITSLNSKLTASTLAPEQLPHEISESVSDDHRRTSLKPKNGTLRSKAISESQITETQTDDSAFEKHNETTVSPSRSSDKKNAELPKKSRATPSIKESHPSRKEHRHVCRNDFGYKHSQSDIKFDNRVSFHGNQECFQGEMLASGGDIPRDLQEEPNIPFTDPSYDRQFAEELSRQQNEDQSEYFYNPTDQPKTLNDWFVHAENLRLRGLHKSGMKQRTHKGHDYVLVLDCSARMKGGKFDTMISTVKAYVNGIKEVSKVLSLKDSIGLAVFGEVSTVVIEPTSDYDILLSQIDLLKAGGDAPLVGGLLMGLAGVLGTGRTTSFHDFQMQGFIYMFTDSLSESTSPSELNPSYSFYDPRGSSGRMVEAESVVTQIADRGLKIYFVSVDEIGKNQIMELAVQRTHGKTIKSSEIHRLIRMTQTILLATTIATDMRFQRTELNKDFVKHKIAQLTSSQDPNDDCADLVFELVNPRGAFAKGGLYAELSCRTLKLGDRVKRGPHWMFDEQDSRLPGTVIGEHEINQIIVEWDSGVKAVYLYDERMQMFSVQKMFNYRIVYDSDIDVGCRVQRGSTWAFGDEDGGIGSKGTVLNVNVNGFVMVRWDNGRVLLYKDGKGHPSSEIKLSDESKVATRHEIPEPRDLSLQNEDVINIDKYIIPVNQKTEVQAVWEYNEDEEWKHFSKDNQLRLEKYYQRNRSGKPLLKIEGKLYQIDLRRMKQINNQNKDEIDIRRRRLSEV